LNRTIGVPAAGRRPPLPLVYRLRPPLANEGPARRPPLLLLLHGVGGNELAMAALAEAFDPRFLVISARSPIELAPFAYAWFHVEFTARGPVIDRDEAEASWIRVADFIEQAVETFGADAARVFVAGFSQGGIVALATILTAPELVAGAVCMSGRLPPEVLARAVTLDRLRDKAIMIAHGVHDDTLGIAYARSASATLREMGLDVDHREFDIGHTTSPESVAAVSSWLTSRLGH
jgi:phospholipase/carboxylesterase